MWVIIINLLKILSIVLPVLIGVAYLTLAERKVIGGIQQRRGPNVVGIFGLLQPLADGLKLLVKETVLPSCSNVVLFIGAPVLTFLLALIAWAVLPFGYGVVLSDVNLGLLYLFAISSLGVYGIIVSGWASNSKYAFLGALRSAAQIVSYEVSIGFIIITVLLCVGSLNITAITHTQQAVWFIVPLLPLFIIFYISVLAETNRHPFDLPEAEAELVAGYNTEYAAIGFALFFLGEYANIIIISAFCVILFIGSWLSPLALFDFLPGGFFLGLKISFLLFVFIWVRAALPRYRYDQLIRLGWKVFLPLSLGWVLLVAGWLLGVVSLPLV